MKRLLLLLLSLSLAGCDAACADALARGPRARGARRAAGAAAPATGGAAPSYNWSPQDVTNAHLYISFVEGSDGTMWQESPEDDYAETRVTASAQRIGLTVDPVSGYDVVGLSTGRRPLYNGSNLVRFAGGASNESLVVKDSQAGLSFLGKDLSWAVAMRLTSLSDTGTHALFDQIGGTTANRGLYIVKLSTNKIRVAVGNAVQVYRIDSSNSLLTTDGEVELIVRHVQGVDNLDIKLNGTTSSGSRSNAFSGSGDATQAARIGITSSSSNEANIDLKDLLIVRGEFSAADEALWSAYDPSSDTNHERQVAVAGDGVPCHSHLQRWYDLSDTASLWQTRGSRTTAVTAATDPIGTVADKSLALANGDQGRDMQATSADNQRPLYDGVGAAFDGSNDEWTLDNAMDSIGGGHTWCIVVTNDNPDDAGNHWLTGGDRMLTTSRFYSSNPPEGPYANLHAQTDPGTVPSVDLPGDQAGDYNAICITQNGTGWQAHARHGGTVTHGTPTTNGAGFSWNDVGQATIAGWVPDDTIVDIRKFGFALSEAEVEVELGCIASQHSSLGL